MIVTIRKNKLKINQILENCIEQRLPFALYRLPNISTVTLIICFKTDPLRKKIDFEDCNSGFVFAPFTNNLPYFFNADLILESSETENFEFEIPEAYLSYFPETENTNSQFSLIKSEDSVDEKFDYISKVNLAIERIRNEEAQKIVLSRRKHIGDLKDKAYFEGFNNLSKSYKGAFVSMVNIPWENQIWLGASPEVLVSQNEEGMFKTVALAGTQSAFDNQGNEIKPLDALWSHKEIEEQAMVSRYIINCLKKIRVREFIELGPKTVVAGNLLHLNTTYTINSREISFSNLSSIMLDLLHPTPAVCGMPKESAELIINQIEDYNREFYSGYLGPVNIKSCSQLFVNIRTMKIENNEVFAFAGGGITEDSDAEKEWNETEIKLQTIQKSFSEILS